jgi:membrane peptidoglycan carboxypeptidase
VGRLSRFLVILALGGAGVGLCLAALIPGTATLFGASRYNGSVTSDLSPLSQRTLVYGIGGEVIGKLGREDRAPAKLNEVPKTLVHAVIATEDRTFYQNAGIDIQATLRALAANVGSGQVEQGGSTITQQLIKNRVVGSKRDVGRKVREAIAAYRLNDEYSKNQILEQYLNTIYLGQGSYGVKSAAERFFITKDPVTGAPRGKQLGELTVADSALLAGLISNPEGNNPFLFPERATKRRGDVLKRMIEQHYITPAEAYVAALQPLPTVKPPAELRPDNYYVDQVQQELFDDLRLGSTPSERRNKVLSGGLKIFTAFDAKAQFLAQSAIVATLPTETENDRKSTAAMVVMDPGTGDVKAMATGSGFDPNHQYNIATHRPGRQEGSTYKAITLTAAMEAGYSPNDSVDGSSPCEVSIPGFKTYDTNNAEPGGGTMSVRSATAGSVNCAFVRLAAGLGNDKVADMARRLGICHHPSDQPTGPCEKPPAFPSLTLGTVEATPLEMATVYNTLAADGVRHDPVFVRRVEGPDGKVIFENKPVGTRVVPAQIAQTVTDLLEGVITGGTGTAAEIDRPAAGKTGTTNSNSDAWFDGYVPQVTAVVWMGHPNDNLPMGTVGSFSEVFGGTYPARIWHAFMLGYLRDNPTLQFTAPDPALWPSGTYVGDKGRTPSDFSARRPSGTTSTTRGSPATTSSSSSTTSSSSSTSSTSTTLKFP